MSLARSCVVGTLSALFQTDVLRYVLRICSWILWILVVSLSCPCKPRGPCPLPAYSIFPSIVDATLLLCDPLFFLAHL